MKKYILLFSMFIFFLGQAQSQSSAKEQETEVNEVKVILKNGSSFFGELVSYDPNEGITVSVNGKEIFIEEKRLRKFVSTASSKEVFKPKLKTNKIYFRTNVGFLTNDNGTGASLNVSALYQLNRYFSAGIGVGVDNYYFNEPHNIFPLFTEFKTYLVDKNSSPYVSLKTGYSFNRAHEDSGQVLARGGFMINPTFGYRFGSRGIMFDLYAGIRMQNAYYEKIQNNGYSRQDIIWKRLEFGTALSF